MTDEDAARWSEQRGKGMWAYVLDRAASASLVIILVNFVLLKYLDIEPYSLFELIPFFILSVLWFIVRWSENEYLFREYEKERSTNL